MFLSAIALQGSSSTAGEMIRSIPRDAAAVLIYVLMAVFVSLIVRGTRKVK